ncbi:DUF3298 domain-containing protein [Lachnospiraceae bacterium 54-53]
MEYSDEEKLLEMKEGYQHIPMPKALRAGVLAGINRAKKEKRKKQMMKMTKRTGVTAAAAVLAIAVMANVSPVTANAMEDIPVIGAIARVVTFRTYEDSKQNYEAKIDIPRVSVNDKDNGAVNRSIEEYAGRLISEYEKEVTGDEAGDGHYSVTSSYDVVTDNEKYLSLRINTTVIMASGAEYVKIFTIDKSTGNVVTLNDLLKDKDDYIRAVSDNIRKQMEDQMAADDSKTYFYRGGDDSVEGFDQIRGDESFYFNENGEIVIVFDEYEVAPGYMGSVEFTIPRSVTGF